MLLVVFYHGYTFEKTFPDTWYSKSSSNTIQRQTKCPSYEAVFDLRSIAQNRVLQTDLLIMTLKYGVLFWRNYIADPSSPRISRMWDDSTSKDTWHALNEWMLPKCQNAIPPISWSFGHSVVIWLYKAPYARIVKACRKFVKDSSGAPHGLKRVDSGIGQWIFWDMLLGGRTIGKNSKNYWQEIKPPNFIICETD